MHGDDLKVKLTDGRLALSGQVPSKREHDQLVQEARARIGSGLHEYDVSGLKIRPKREQPGLLAQTLVAAYAHRDTADLALRFVLEHSRPQPLRTQILEEGSDASEALPHELIEDAKKQLDRGQILLALDVDETDAFRVRALLEDSRSTWTVAAPPRLAKSGN